MCIANRRELRRGGGGGVKARCRVGRRKAGRVKGKERQG